MCVPFWRQERLLYKIGLLCPFALRASGLDSRSAGQLAVNSGHTLDLVEDLVLFVQVCLTLLRVPARAGLLAQGLEVLAAGGDVFELEQRDRLRAIGVDADAVA